MNRLDRIKGCLLADALGAPGEFCEWNTIQAEFGPQRVVDFTPAYGISGVITDALQMMLFTAEGLLRAYVRGSSRGIRHVPGVMRSYGCLSVVFFTDPMVFALALPALDRQNVALVAVAESKSFMSSQSLNSFTRCSLIVPETRVVAAMLLQGISKQEWQRQIVELNVLQKRTAKTATTYASMARSRLETMDSELWELVRDGSLPVATQAVLAATVKFSPLFGDFLRTVVRDQFRRFSTHLEPRHWNTFLEDRLHANLDTPTFSESTRVKLRQNAMRMLAEAGFIDDTRSLRLRSQHIEPAVFHFLHQHNEQYVLDCLQVCP